MNKLAGDLKPEVEITAPHVLQAINAVMRELNKLGIAKDRKNTQQNYSFRGIDDVYNVLCGLLADSYLVITPKCLTHSRDFITTGKGAQAVSATVMVEYEFHSAIDGSMKTVGPFPGEAMDYADKATNKAMSAAYKYMAMQEFCIPTEGDNDADATTHQIGRQPSLEDKALNVLRGAGADRGLLKEAWEKNKDGWKKMLPREAYARLVGEVSRLVEAPPKDEPPPPPPAADFGIGDDEIPF